MKHLLTLAIVLCLGAFTSAQIPSYVPTNGLVGWWPFNGNANDESGNGNHGTVNGATLAADRFGNLGKAYNFSSNPQNIQVPITLNQVTQYSFSAFVRKNSSSNNIEGTIISFANPCNGPGGLRLHIGTNNEMCFGSEFRNCSSAWKYSNGFNFADNQWHHFVGIFNSNSNQISVSDFTIFVDGQMINQTGAIQGNQLNVIAPISNSSNPFYFGNSFSLNNNLQDFFNGLLDDIAIYNRALTAAEVQQLYTGQSACNLTVNLAPSDTLAACGNSVNLNAGNPGANYLWNTGDSSQSISATQSGWYRATVTQNNCSATDSVYMNLLQVDLGNDTTVCRGRSLQLTSKSIGNINNPLRLPSDSASLKQLGYITGPQGGPNCTVHTETKWIKTLGVDYVSLFTVQHRFYDKSRIYNKQNQLIWEWAGESVPSTTWYGRKHQLYIGGNDSIRIEFYSGYPNFCVGSLSVTKLIFSTNYQSSTLWSTGDSTPTINVTPTQTTTYYCTVSDGISTCTDSVTVFVTQPPVLSLPDTLRSATRPVVLAPGNASTYLWSTGDSTANLSVNTAGTYSVTASNAAGCSSADTVLVLFSNPAPALPAASAGMFNYQASVVSGGKPLANRSLSVRFTVADSTATNYSEIQQITTDARGHFATQVGAGSPISGSLSDVSWWDGLSRTLKTEVDTNGSGNWVVLGSSSLVAVPVSMYALRSGDGSRSIYGSFDSNGNVVSGRGFSVTPLGNGKFELMFQQPFTELPNVIVKLVGSGTYSDKIINRNTQKTTIEITGNPDQIQFEAKGK